MAQDAFEAYFKDRWFHEVSLMTIEGQALDEAHTGVLAEQFYQTPMDFIWYQNTDTSVNGHVTDTEKWVRANIHENNINMKNEQDAINLGLHVNKQRKKVGKHSRFFPVARMLDDGLYRFAKGLSPHCYPNNPDFNFPSPYDS